MLHKNCIATIITILSLTQSAHALNLQGYQFSDSYRYSLLDDSLREKFEGNYVATASLAHVNSPFYFSDTYLHDHKKDIIESNNILTVGFSYYLNKNVSLGADLNAVHNEVMGDTHTTLADSVIKSRINIKRTEKFSLSLNPQVFIPTGDADNFTTQESVGAALSLVAETSMDRFHFLASVGGMNSKNNEFSEVDHRQLLLSQLGISYDVNDKFNVNAEAFRKFPLVNDTLQDEGKYFLTAKHKTHSRFSTYFGVGASGLQEVRRDTYSGFVGIKFHEPMAAAPVTVAQAPQEQEEFVMEEIYFDHGRSDLKDSAKENLKERIQWFKKASSVVLVEGYASLPGSIPYNKALSIERARVVKDYLISQGVSADKLEVIGFGEEFEQNPDEAMNRKVYFRIKQ